MRVPAFLLLLAAALAALALPGCGGRDGTIRVTPLIHDFGRVRQGEKPLKTFTITNGTDRVISIMPQPNCACFAVPRGRSLEPLDPGASMDVQVMFDSTAKPPGPVQGKWISFNFDHPRQKQINVPLQGEIYRAYEIRPAMLKFGRIDGRPDNHKARVITVRPERGYAVRVDRVVPAPVLFDHEIRPGPEGAVEVHLTLKRGLPPRKLGGFKAFVRVEMTVTSPDGSTFTQRPTLPIEGTWAIKPDGTPLGRAR